VRIFFYIIDPFPSAPNYINLLTIISKLVILLQNAMFISVICYVKIDKPLYPNIVGGFLKKYLFN
jgi:hypothetical protein